MASTAVAGITLNKSFEFIKYPKIGFIATMIGVIVLIATVGLSYIIFEQGRASVSFQRAIVSVTQNADANIVEAKILDAIRLSKRDIYYRSLAQLNVSRINTLIAEANGKTEITEEQRNEFQKRTASAVEAARLAELSDPSRLENKLIVAQVYSTIVPVGVEELMRLQRLVMKKLIRLVHETHKCILLWLNLLHPIKILRLLKNI